MLPPVPASGWMAVAAAYGFMGVAFGAFGAHALKARLPAEMLAVWRTAVEYQFWHALALLAVGVLARGQATTALTVSGWSFALGVLLFSGSLYLLALTGLRVLGAVTPLGGVLLLAGWAALFCAVLKAR